MSEINRKTFERLENRTAKIICGAYCIQGDCILRLFANMQKMQCAGFMSRCWNTTAPEVFHKLFKKVDHRKNTRANGRSLNISMIKKEIIIQ